MKTKKHMILAALISAVFCLGLYAQPPGGGRGFQMTEEDIKERVDQNAATLELSEAQHKKYMDVELDFYNRMQIERQKMRSAGAPPPNREAMRSKMMEMRDERNAKIKEILTEEQFAKFTEMQEQRRNEMRQQRPGQAPGAQPSERPARGRGRG